MQRKFVLESGAIVDIRSYECRIIGYGYAGETREQMIERYDSAIRRRNKSYSYLDEGGAKNE